MENLSSLLLWYYLSFCDSVVFISRQTVWMLQVVWQTVICCEPCYNSNYFTIHTQHVFSPFQLHSKHFVRAFLFQDLCTGHCGWPAEKSRSLGVKAGDYRLDLLWIIVLIFAVFRFLVETSLRRTGKRTRTRTVSPALTPSTGQRKFPAAPPVLLLKTYAMETLDKGNVKRRNNQKILSNDYYRKSSFHFSVIITTQ